MERFRFQDHVKVPYALKVQDFFKLRGEMINLFLDCGVIFAFGIFFCLLVFPFSYFECFSGLFGLVISPNHLDINTCKLASKMMNSSVFYACQVCELLHCFHMRWSFRVIIAQYNTLFIVVKITLSITDGPNLLLLMKTDDFLQKLHTVLMIAES